MEEVKISFKIADLNDVPAIIDLCNECFDESTNLEYAIKTFQETMHDTNQIYLIGIVDGEAICHTKITIIPTIYEEMGRYAIINHVCVKPTYRRLNIATKMLDEVSRICKEKKCKAIELWSNNFRVAAHECYKKYGFLVNDAKFFSKELD